MSPRDELRQLMPDGYSDAGITPRGAAAPAEPWAVHLTDARFQFRLLGFDFDAKGATEEIRARARAAAQHAADELARMLQQCGIEYVACESGPSRGRHVWVALAETMDLDDVVELADLARSVFGRVTEGGAWVLDIGMLCNRTMGLLRPPGAPHPAGGASTILAGDPAVLLPAGRSTTRAQVAALSRLLTAARAAQPVDDRYADGAARTVTVAEADDGHLWIPGTRREIAGQALAKLHAPIAPDVDTSDVLFSLLCSCARAHWTFTEVHTRLAALPGMEHARTRRSKHNPDVREPRPRKGSQSPKRVLAADWQRAVRFLEANSVTFDEDGINDHDFARRTAIVGAQTAAIQCRADADMRRWSIRGGAADRLVLDALCEIADTVVQLSVGADIRTLAERAGVSRETSRRALIRLAQNGAWVSLHTEHAGPHAAVWSLTTAYGPALATTTPDAETCTAGGPPGSSSEGTIHVSLGATGPDGAVPLPSNPPLATEDGPMERRRAIAEASRRRDLATHDAFTGTGREDLSTWDALVYSRLPIVPARIEDVLPRSTPVEALVSAVERLHACGLIELETDGTVRRLHKAARDGYAAVAGTVGTLDARIEQHRLERELWAWWLDEMMWTTTAGRSERRRGYRSARRRLGQQTLDVGAPSWVDRAPYPRRPGGRRDHRAARAWLHVV
ncbi:hypothetical protein ACLQ3K_24760 [Tsukamurella sp. DT100]|uniref:hypothetical protein n=1 Tax=Tsukamurella sp. DT100 TaxID=3393415 RepID=UPI003CF68058